MVVQRWRTGHLGRYQVGMRIHVLRPQAVKDSRVQAGRGAIDVVHEEDGLGIGALDALVQLPRHLANSLAPEPYPLLHHRVHNLQWLGYGRVSRRAAEHVEEGRLHVVEARQLEALQAALFVRVLTL